MAARLWPTASLSEPTLNFLVLDAGIDIKIVTGDTPATAREIGRQIGLWKDSDTDSEIVTGPDFAEIPDKELPERVKSIKIIARARPLL